MKQALVNLEYQNYFEPHFGASAQNYAHATSNDATTITYWRNTWTDQITKNHSKYGPFSKRGIGQHWGKFQYRPCIVAGAGPSLRENAPLLKDKPDDIPLISCLHNFHFLEDLGVKVDAYVTLDAGDITVFELTEGGTKTDEEYWAMTKGKVLYAFIGTHPKLLEKWQGELYFFNCPIPDQDIMEFMDNLEPFHTYVSTGGNVLGACVYIAKGIWGCPVTAFIGANFSFGYNDKFHSWDSKYDKNLGNYMRVVDIYGNKVKTWQSYWNFKNYFDWLCGGIPGIWINCTEGGCLGAYPEGNINSIKQMDLKDFLKMVTMHTESRENCENPITPSIPRKLVF